MRLISIFALVSVLVSSPAWSATVDATYEVPMRDPKLLKYARFELNDVEVTHGRLNALQIAFDMPKDLVGKDLRIELFQVTAQAAGDVRLEGDLANADCKQGAEALACTIRYTFEPHYGVSTFFRLVTRSHYISRMKVVQAFAREPIGILTIKN